MSGKEIRLFFSRRRNGMINFGDDISPLLVEAITGRKTSHARVSTCDYAAIGSIIEMIAERRLKRLRKLRFDPIRIWGSGCLTTGGQISDFMTRPIALRGPLTQQRLRGDHQVPLGDPGLLFDRLHQPGSGKKYKWGLILHYMDAESPALQNLLANTPGIVNIPVEAPPLETLRVIGECEYIASSSLHGLIAADCYGIPNVRLRVGPHLDKTNSKFLDYAAAIERPDIAAVQVPDSGCLDDIFEYSDAGFAYFSKIPAVAQALEQALVNSL